MVCGLSSELAALGGWVEDARVEIGISGADPDQAEDEARRLVEYEGCTALLSWGIAGGLSPGIRTGMLVIPTVIRDREGGNYVCTTGSTGGIDAVACPLLGSETLVMASGRKSGLFLSTGAMAVDMESHRIARVAQRAGIPFACVRAIADPAERDLPPMVQNAVTANGDPRVFKVLLGLLFQPWHLMALWRLKRDNDRALATLAGRADEVMAACLQMTMREAQDQAERGATDENRFNLD